MNDLKGAGSPPCHVSVNRDKGTVVTANYHMKNIVSYLLNEDGSLKQTASVVEDEGRGTHERQEKNAYTFAGFTPDEK